VIFIIAVNKLTTMFILNIPQKNYLPVKIVEANGFLCPCCDKTGIIVFTFYQVQFESEGNINTTKKISVSAVCKSCTADIPNIHFTKEMDAFYKAAQKNIIIKSSFKMAKMERMGKMVLYFSIIFFGAIFLLLAWLYIYSRYIK
jgi:hypothetical protein